METNGVARERPGAARGGGGIPWGAIVAWVVFGLGCGLRTYVVFQGHEPRHNIFSDALDYVRTAILFAEEGTQEQMNAVWPPGNAGLLSLGYLLDPSLRLAAAVALWTSCLVPLLVAHVAGMLFGGRAFLVALVLASLHPGYVHYASFFLSEHPTFVTVVVAAWCATIAAKVATPWVAQTLALTSGAWAGLAFAARGPVLPVVVVAALGAVATLPPSARRRGLANLGFGALAFGFVAVVLSVRCTTLNHGHFCPGAVNGPMNMALGHCGELGGLEFPADERGGFTHWSPPSLFGLHRYSGTGHVPASIFNSGGVLRWLEARFRAHPDEVLLESVGNVFDMASIYLWPIGPLGKIPVRTMEVWQQAFLMVALPAGLVGGARALRGGLRGRRSALVTSPAAMEVALAFTLLGAVLTAALTMGETRYRMPWDVALVVLASGVLAGPRGSHESCLARTAPLSAAAWRTGLVVGALGLFVTGAVLAMVSPSVSPTRRWLVEHLPNLVRRAPLPSRIVRGRAEDLRSLEPEQSAWNGPGTVVLPCQGPCTEVVLDLAAPHTGGSIAVGADANDAYLARFYHQGQVVGEAVVPLGGYGMTGIAQRSVPYPNVTPARAVDAIGITPLFGDGRYSVAYIRE